MYNSQNDKERERHFAGTHKAWAGEMGVYARRWLRDTGAADDIVQEAFLALWKNWDSVAGQSAKAWLYACVRNACLNHNRNNARRQNREQNYEYSSHSTFNILQSNIEQQLIYAETIGEIYALVKTLPPHCQAVFRLIYLKDLSHAETTAELHISESTVRTQKAQALSILRKMKISFLLFLIEYLALSLSGFN